MENWNKISDLKLPEPGKTVITWNGKEFRICHYKKVLTWKGYRYKFVNIMTKYGFWNDDETHWTYFPNPPAPIDDYLNQKYNEGL